MVGRRHGGSFYSGTKICDSCFTGGGLVRQGRFQYDSHREKGSVVLESNEAHRPRQTNVLEEYHSAQVTVERIISGGQTGVDRAALEVARKLQIPSGGWCPKGRRAEDGRIGLKYPLQETPSEEYAQRTRWNVRDSDGTLIISRGELAGGTALTALVADKLGKPCLAVDLDRSDSVTEVAAWLQAEDVRVLNVAGPRESGQPRIYDEAFAFLDGLFGEAGIDGRGSKA